MALFLALFLAPALCLADDAHKPARIVSLNLCTDELVLRLADRRNVASVTYLAATSGTSNVAELAAQIPVNHGQAEEIIRFNPDLVVASVYTARSVVTLMKRAGIPVLDLAMPDSLNDVREQIREAGRAFGEDARAAAIIAGMDRRLAAVPLDPAQARPRALALRANGYTIGKGTLTDDIMMRAGMENVAATLGIDGFGQISLETLVTSAVDVLILNASRDGAPALATEMLRHPVLTKMPGRMRIAVVPNRMWACAGPGNVDAAVLLSGVADEVRRKEARE